MKQNHPLLLLVLLCLLCSFTAVTIKTDEPKPDAHTRIAFGSCNDQRQPQPLWPSIVATQPDLWLWLGDNIYADTWNMVTLLRSYQFQQQHEGYQQLLQTTPITGIWDDHDYAYDNAGKYFTKKEQSQQLFLDFIGEPKDAPVRKQEGIYRSYILGEGDQKVKILLLDVHYHRDRLNIVFDMYLPNYSGDVLGEAQWQWLERELTNSDASVHLIASGTQVLPTGLAYTNWSSFPQSRKRLLELIEKTHPAIPLLLSGDRHVGELGKIELEGYKQPLYEITSSGMTHHRRPRKTGNIYRVGEQIGALNFGILDIAWEKDYTAITMEIRGEGNKVLLEQKVVY